MKAKSLHGLEVSHRTGLVGDLVRKSAAYDVWALEPAVDRAQGSGSGSEDQGEAKGTVAKAHAGLVGAEELNNLSVLLPCKRRGGKLQLGAYDPLLPAKMLCGASPPSPSPHIPLVVADCCLLFPMRLQLRSPSHDTLSSSHAPQSPRDWMLP